MAIREFSRLEDFCGHVAALSDGDRLQVARAYDAAPRYANGHLATVAVWAAADAQVSNGDRFEARQMAREACGTNDSFSDAAECAANEIQAGVQRTIEKADFGLSRFHFLPMFGFTTPADIPAR